MIQDTLVIDIETKNTFLEVGKDNFEALKVSLIGLYSYKQDKFFSFGENEIAAAAEFLKKAGLLIGFSISRFDLPVLKYHFGRLAGWEDFDPFLIPRVDILDEIEFSLGRRVGLNILAKTNLGFGKNGKGLEAPNLYREGKIEELKDYCLNDVKITKDLYELAKKQGYLMIPQKDIDKPIKLEMDISSYPQTIIA